MKTCSDYKEQIALDVHEALGPQEHTVLEIHLAECEECRQEREKLLGLVLKAKEGLCVPGLSSEEEHLLSGSLQRTLRVENSVFKPKRAAWWLAPACAACMVLVVAGWFGLRGPATISNNPARTAEEGITANQELLENMDLLLEMESLEQLVDLLDKQYPETTLLEKETNEVRVHV